MKLYPLIFLFLCLCLIMPINAQTISFIDPGISDSESNTELIAYYGNGTLAGVLTTNDSLVVDPNADLLLHKRNKQISIFDDPIGFLHWILDTLGYAIILIVAGVIIGVGIIGIAVQAAKGSKSWTSGGKKRWG